MMFKTKPTAFWIGLIIYAASFCLMAVGEGKASPGDQPFLGIFCAWFALAYPWVQARDVLLHNVPPVMGPQNYVSLLISGLINPLFLLTAFLDLIDLYPRLVNVLRVVLVLMIPFSWIIIFSYLHAYPREGHVLWVIGILLVLFSGKLSTVDGR